MKVISKAFTPTGNRRLNELIGFVLCVFAGLLFFALVSYSPQDASWNSSANSAAEAATGYHNWIGMVGASTAGVWGWTDRPGTLAHWPGGIVVSFPKSKTVNGTIVMAPGDINLTFKRYLASPIRITLKDDYVTDLQGEGADAMMMRGYLAAWGDREAYAVSHVGWGMNPGARYEALSMYDQRDTNGTELRAVAGNFLFSTGANEFAGRYTAGHFDLPMMGTTIELDGVAVVREGVLQDVFG